MSFRRIEFIGASGIGKTTLLHALLRQRPAGEPWVTPREAVIKLARRQTCPLRANPWRAGLALALKWNVAPRKSYGLALRILQPMLTAARHACGPDYEGLTSALEDWLQTAEELSPRQQEYARAFYRGLLDRQLLLDFGQVPEWVVDDDGLISNNPGLAVPETVRARPENHPRRQEKFRPAAAIYCFLDLDEYHHRRLQKKSGRRGTFLDRNLTAGKSLGLCRRVLEGSARKAEWLQAENTPMLALNMAGHLQDNAVRAHAFIRQMVSVPPAAGI